MGQEAPLTGLIFPGLGLGVRLGNILGLLQATGAVAQLSVGARSGKTRAAKYQNAHNLHKCFKVLVLPLKHFETCNNADFSCVEIHYKVTMDTKHARPKGSGAGYLAGAAKGFVSAALRQAGREAAKRAIGRDFQTPSKKRKVAKARRASGVVYPDGSSTGKRQVSKLKKRGGQKPRSLKKRIQALEKNKAPDSNYQFDECYPFKINNAQPNRGIMYRVDALSPTVIESFIDSLDGVDMTAKNTTVLLNNIYMEAWLKNAKTGNVTLEYCWVTPKDNDGEDFLQDLAEDYADRGVTAGTIGAASPATATASILPKYMLFNDEKLHFNKWSTNATNKAWHRTKVERVTLGPGDTIQIVKKIPKISYKPEDQDQEPFAYMRNYTYHLMIYCRPDLCHDETNVNLVGFGLFGLDGYMRTRMNAKVSDGLGLRAQEYNSTLTTTGLTVPVHVDNFASKVEIDDN